MLAALLGITVLVLLVHDIPLTSYLRHVEYDRIITGLERDSFIIVGNAHEAVEEPTAKNRADLENVLNKYRAKSEAVVIVTNSDGQIVASTDPAIAVGEHFKTRPEISKALTGKVASGSRFSKTLNYELFYVAVPMVKGHKVYGSVRITFPTTAVDRLVNSRLRAIALVAGVTLVLAVLIALLLATSVTRRLNRLRNVTEEFTSGNYEIRADSNSGAPEIKSLAYSFNLMADRLTNLLTQQRAFAGDASHQLRTPLTALKLRLEMASELITTDPTGATERIDAALVETERLQNIVEGLLVLSRADGQTATVSIEIDIAPILTERIKNWEALAGESGVSLVAKIPSEVRVLAIPGVVEQVIDNYLDNALHVAPANSKIVIRVIKEQETTTIHIADQGPGIASDNLDKAFNRFWRGQSDVHGSGLGLAIVERLVQACDGTVQLENLAPHGIDAQATFKNA